MDTPERKKIDDAAMRRFSGLFGDDAEAGDGTVPQDVPATIGRYRVRRAVAEGASGRVYEAEDQQLGRRVAIKVLNEGSNQSFLRRFHREATLAGKLRHPNIVPIHEISMVRRDDGVALHFIVMDFYDRTLQQEMEEGLDRRRGIEILEGVARAIAHAHDQGIIHRDLKPGNILMDGAGRPIVSDFGLARQDTEATQLTRSGCPIGTPSYMSPEQAAGRVKDVGPLSDIYALGVMLYEIVTGRLPHAGESVGDIYAAILTQDPPRPRTAAPDVDQDLETVCLKAMEREPALRYRSATDFADDLKRYLSGEPVRAKPLGVTGRWRRRIARRPAAWIGGLATAAIVVGLSAGIWRLAGKTTETAGNLTRTTEDLRRTDLARQISAAYLELNLKTLEPMRELGDYFHGEFRGSPDAALAAVQRTVDAVAAKYPLSREPAAWRALSLYYACKPEGTADLTKAAAEAGPDPIPILIVVRALLSTYARDAQLPGFYLSGAKVIQTPFVETPIMIEVRARVEQLLGDALKCEIWPKLESGREYESYAKGAQLLSRKEFGKAAAILSQLREDPGLRDDALWLAGIGWYLDGKYVEAAEAFEVLGRRRWVRCLITAGTSRMTLGAVEMERGGDPRHHYEEALRDFNDCISRSPTKDGPYSLRGIVETRLGQLEASRGGDPLPWYEKAVADHSESLKIRESVETLNNRGIAYQCIGHRTKDARSWYEKAVDDFERAVALQPAYPASYTNGASVLNDLAQHENKTGQDPRPSFQKAVGLLDTVLRLKQEFSNSRSMRAYINLALANAVALREGDAIPVYDAVIADYDLLIPRQPAESSYYYNRGLSHLNKGMLLERAGKTVPLQWESAVRDFQETIRLNAGHQEAHAWHGLAQEKLGHDDEARAAYRKALALNPNDERVRLQLNQLEK